MKRILFLMLMAGVIYSCDEWTDDDINNSRAPTYFSVHNVEAVTSIETTLFSAGRPTLEGEGFSIKSEFNWQIGGDIPNEARTNLELSKTELKNKHPFQKVVRGAYVALKQMTITADKTLYNIPAGESLNDHFYCDIADWMSHPISYPQGIIEIDNPIGHKMRMNDPLLYDNYIVPKFYSFTPIDTPEEQYDSVVFEIHFEFSNGTECTTSKTMGFR